ncbi:MAG: hypothetical protein IT370_01695 [Deltaproteobacteria bacterium]|nr:hypothetical protein [Deltaproteobacteria bacterium]
MKTGIKLAALMTLAAVSCGGGEASFRIKYRFDDVLIAGVDPSQKTSVVDAQQRIIVAQQEWQKATHDVNEMTTQIQLAQSDLDVKNSMLKSARLESSVANKSADQNRIGNANRALKTAQLGQTMAQRKVAWMRAKKAYLKAQQKYFKTRVDFETAGYELAKAKIAAARNIRPKGFNLQNYQNQQSEGARFLNKTKQASAKQEAAMTRAQGQYTQAKAAYDGSRGTPIKPATGGPGMTPTPTTTTGP